MASLRTTIPFWILSMLLLFTSMEAGEYVVGGNNCSWEIPISSVGSLQEWAQSNRFFVGDILIFEYDPKFDSVLRVTKEDYETCNNETKPIEKYDDGRTKIELDRSGPFYFIGGQGNDSCAFGQRLTVVVISDQVQNGKHNHTHVAPTPAPTTSIADPPITSGAPHELRVGFMGIFLMGVLGTSVGIALL